MNTAHNFHVYRTRGVKRPNYLYALEDLVSQVENFNEYLSPEHYVRIELDCLDLENKSFWDINWTDYAYSGMFVILGTDDYTGEDVFYFGISPSNKSISTKLYTLLSAGLKPLDDGFSYCGAPFTLYRVYTINLEREKLTFMASALKEYLMANTSIKLLNAVNM